MWTSDQLSYFTFCRMNVRRKSASVHCFRVTNSSPTRRSRLKSSASSHVELHIELVNAALYTHIIRGNNIVLTFFYERKQNVKSATLNKKNVKYFCLFFLNPVLRVDCYCWKTRLSTVVFLKLIFGSIGTKPVLLLFSLFRCHAV